MTSILETGGTGVPGRRLVPLPADHADVRALTRGDGAVEGATTSARSRSPTSRQGRGGLPGGPAPAGATGVRSRTDELLARVAPDGRLRSSPDLRRS